MCGGSSQTTKNKIPSWLESAGKSVWSEAEKFYNKDYKPYPGEMVADFTPMQKQAFEKAQAFGNGSNPLFEKGFDKAAGFADNHTAENWLREAGGMIRDASAPASNTSIQKYMNPYLESVLAPTLTEVEKNARLQRRDIGDAAASANAFGDFRHGLLDQESMKDERRSIEDATSRGYSSAWDNALAMRGDDMSRKLAGAQGLIGAGTAFNADSIAELQALFSAGDKKSEDMLSRMQTLFTSGGAKQQQFQNKIDAKYNEYGKGQQDEYDRLAAMVSVLGQTPYSRTQVTTKDNGMGDLFGLLGSLIPGFG